MGRAKEPEMVEGKVLKITFKETRGDNDLCSICLDTGGKDDEWFGFGFNEPNFKEGAVIEFEVEENDKGFWNVVEDTVEVLEAAPEKRRGSSKGGSKRGGSSRSGGRSGSSRSSGRSGAGSKRSSGRDGGGRSKSSEGGKKSEVDWDRKDNLIRLQSSQNTAVATINMMIAHGAIVIPKKKADAFDLIQAAVEEEASRLFDKYTDIVDGNYEGGPAMSEDDENDIPD